MTKFEDAQCDNCRFIVCQCDGLGCPTNQHLKVVGGIVDRACDNCGFIGIPHNRNICLTCIRNIEQSPVKYTKEN